MQRIKRDEYLNFLIRNKDKQLIKVVSGVRRCGKSTLFEIYRDYLLDSGISNDQIIWINFEDIDFESLCDYRTLYDYVKTKLIPDKMNYVFLDEIQHVKHFEKAVDSLFIKKNVDVYITGSNAYFMSGELATLLSGRYIELKMLPLSFSEYCDGLDIYYPDERLSKHEKYASYIADSSLPYALTLRNRPKELTEYLTGIFNTILVKDVITRYKISDPAMLESITKFVFDNIGNILSSRSIANTMTSYGRKIDSKTVEKYLNALSESLIIHKAQRYNIKGKQLLAFLEKYYVADVGLRNMLLGGTSQDQGHILENIVYLELLRRGYSVHVGIIADGEIDFVASNSNGIEYYQVSASVLDNVTLKRELSPFEKISDHFPKFLLTLDDIGANSTHNGIKQLNVLDWLLDK